MRRLRSVGVALVTGLALGVMPAGGQGSESANVAEAETPPISGQLISERVMAAWASGSEADIDAAYDPSIGFHIGTRELAGERGPLLEVIRDTIEAGDSVHRVGPVVESRRPSGDLIVATMLEFVEGTRLPAEGSGDLRRMLLLCTYRVPEALVTEQTCLEVEEPEEDAEAAAPADAHPDSAPIDGQLVADRALAAWASGDQADIEAAFAPDVQFWVGEWHDASDRAELTEDIHRFIERFTLRQLGPLIEHRLPSGPLIVGTMLDFEGSVDGDHRSGVVVCYYRVPADLISEQVCLGEVRDPESSEP